jgi:hypothetical protein
MWRAWGITLLLLSPQELGTRARAPEHEIALRPPSGWIRHPGAGPIVARFTQPGEFQNPPEFTITHLFSSNPTPLEAFKRQAREGIKEKYVGSKILEEKDLQIAGKGAYRIVFESAGIVYLKTVVHRTNIEYYLLDGAYPTELAAQVKPVLEASIATLEIVPTDLSSEERLAETRVLSVLKDAKIDPALLGERWYTIHVSGRKIGHMRVKMSEAKGSYAFDSEVRNDFGDGNSDVSSSRGEFSPDGSKQKLEAEQTKTSPKLKWAFKATATIDGGQARIHRDVNGVVEDRTLKIEEGVLLNDIAECLRPTLVGAGKGVYLFKILSPYSDEWTAESVEVSGPENVEIYGKPTDCIFVQTSVGVRRKSTYTYLPDRTLLRVGGPKDVVSVRASTKDEALKP